MTTHKIYYQDARRLSDLENESVQLIITSPPYPMIEMWDDVFAVMNPEISAALSHADGQGAFSLMHRELEKVWAECYRVLNPGGMFCINIGDATRTLEGNFQLWSNHSQIIRQCLDLGFQNLPNILWRKPTNSPTKFMGSGMLPPGAYVTLEHEFILIFRKGRKREFRTTEERQNRRESAFFWEERNRWFSDIWRDLKGIGQNLSDSSLRQRSAAYPFNLAYRLINMFSVKNDVVLDPFLGTGTTLLTAMVAERDSLGYEIDPEFGKLITSQCENIPELSGKIISERLKNHDQFVAKRKKPLKYFNEYHQTPVMSRQEVELRLRRVVKVEQIEETTFTVQHRKKIV